jgi:serine phosphatase RsbU (regulator of sigma subunit)
MLEPAYEVGGDAMDYAVNEDVAHLAVFDAMGHGLQASLLASLAVGAYRNARRAGRDLVETGLAIDEALGAQFGGERFVTAVLCQLDLERGSLRWIVAGHPPPLLVRDGRVVKELDERPDRPLGLGMNTRLTVHEEALEPGDRLFVYTDGVVEARDEQGEQFGLERLVDFLARADAADEPVPETMRRLSKAVLAHQRDQLQDDATHVLLAWRDDVERLVP